MKVMDEKQLFGQPINPAPGDSQYVPQPLGNTPKPGKKLWLIIAGALGLLLILGGLYWVLAKNAKSDYDKAAVSYKQQIKEVRDGMNTKLDDGNISVYDPEAPPIFEEYGKKMQDIISAAPKSPTVLGFIPAGKADPEVTALTSAAVNYASELRHINQLFEFYTGIANDFKPIKDLGRFTVLDTAEIKALPGLWETFLTKLNAVEPPIGLESLKADLILQGEALLTKFKELADGFDQRNVGQNDELVKGLEEPVQAFNKTFVRSSGENTKAAIDKVNQFYDDLDKLLQ